MTRFLKDYFLQYTNQKFRLPLKEFCNEIGTKSRIGAKKWKPIFFRRRKQVDPEIRCLLINGFEVNFPLKKYRSWVRVFFGFHCVVVDICFKTGLYGRRIGFRKKNLRGYFFLATETGFFCRVISRFESLKIISRHFSIDLSQKCYNREHSGQKSKAASKRKRKMVLPYKWIIHLYYN